ncbi:baseplate assembly protein [Novosphingobium huizhouense]|uniref:baseplate assembly protein n=1 Tax=Novosphingobium huizhouense TaxID=2866625 RepID=UPI001CD8F3BA|nr:baseplate J/gp47 family protein [Novosphingobium huizhouense]
MPIASDSFTGVDLSRLPAPDVVEPLDFETIRTQALSQFEALCEEAGIPFDAAIESDPVVKLLELFAWRELQLRARVNDAARAVMVAHATGADLDALGALFQVERWVVRPADVLAGTPEVLESDADFRRRIVLAPEGYSTAGPAGGYIFHALSASPDVLDASATSPAPGQVVVTVLSRIGSGAASPDLIAAVTAALHAETVRPITDQVIVQSAQIVSYAINATLTFLPGPDKALVVAEARRALDSYIAETHRLGRDVMRAGIIGSLFVPGVQNVLLTQPSSSLVVDPDAASWCTSVTLTDGGTAT